MPAKEETKRGWWRHIAYAFVLLTVGIVAGAIGWVKHNAPKLSVAAVKAVVLNIPPEKVFKSKSFSLLLLGCDDEFLPDGTTTTVGSRSDMMMLLKFNFDHKSITGMSIPRDTFVRLPSYENKFHKINAFHAYGGEPLAKQAVESVLKVKVDKVARLNFNAFVDAVNLLGGVTINAQRDLEYTDHSDGLYIRIKKGRNDLNGYGALGFVRFRHDDSDFARQERQHEFVSAMKAKMARNPTAALQVADKLIPLLDGAFSGDEMATLMRFSLGLNAGQIKFSTTPTQQINGNVVVNRAELPGALAAASLTPELGDPQDGSNDWKPTSVVAAPGDPVHPVATPKAPHPKHNVPPQHQLLRPRRAGGQQGQAKQLR